MFTPFFAKPSSQVRPYAECSQLSNISNAGKGEAGASRKYFAWVAKKIDKVLVEGVASIKQQHLQ